MQNEINKINGAVAAYCAEINELARSLTSAIKNAASVLANAPIHKIDDPAEVAALSGDYVVFARALNEARGQMPKIDQREVVEALRALTTVFAKEIENNRLALQARQKRSRAAMKLEQEEYLALHQ